MISCQASPVALLSPDDKVVVISSRSAHPLRSSALSPQVTQPSPAAEPAGSHSARTWRVPVGALLGFVPHPLLLCLWKNLS